MRLPRARLDQRVGPDALALVRAVEQEGELIVPYQPVEWLETDIDIDIDQFALALRPLVEHLTAQLQERHLGAGIARFRLADSSQALKLESQARVPGRSADTAAILEVLLRELPHHLKCQILPVRRPWATGGEPTGSVRQAAGPARAG
jgi:hypothetical protein